MTTDLITTDSNELDFETNKINDQEIVIPASKKKFDNKLTKTTKLKDNFLPSLFSSKLLLVGWGCLAGAIGVFLVKSRMAKSYSPIIKYGKVKGKIVTIDNIYAGKLKTLNYEVGDLVKAKEIVAEIESQSNKEKSKTIQEITNQIEKINNHIESQKQSQLVNQSNLNRDRKKLKELLAKNSDFNYNTISKQGKSTFDEQLNLQNVQKEVDEASTNYDKLQKLLEQKAVSLEEVERAKQNWKALQKKLTQLQNNSQSQNLADLLQQVEKRKAIDQNNLQYIQENIERWETQISDQDNTIKLLVQDLNDAKDRLKILYDSYQATQIINVKAPVRGAISQIKINNNEVIDENQTFIELVDCNNLWVEVIVNNSLLEKINMRQAVLLSLEAHQFSLPSKISSIYPMQNYHKKNSENSLDYVSGSKNISNQNTLDNQSLFKIKIDFPIPENHAQKIMFCGWQETATIIFNN